MKFRVTRTSQWKDEKPCEEVKEETAKYYDYRNTTKEEMIKQHGNRFCGYINTTLRSGVQGCYKEMGEEKIFTMEINTIDELAAFAHKYGQIIIIPNEELELPEIEIYDYYRE